MGGLRVYQQDAVARLAASYAAGKRAPLFVLPTGGGKTHTFAHIAEGAARKQNRVLVLVHRQELLKQASRSLSNLGVAHGIIAPKYRGENDQVAVASIQTLGRRIRQTQVSFDLVIIDEAHHAGAKTWSAVLSHFPNSKLLGVTATPIRLDGRGLGVQAGGFFDDLIVGPTITELIAQEHLVPPIVYAYPNKINLTTVRRVRGDFDIRAAAVAVDKPTITGDALDHYHRLSPGEPAIAFCASIQHAVHVAEQFNRGGYKFKVIHGKLKDQERSEMIADLAVGRIHGLASVDLISEGTDIPVCSVAILLRPTQSVGLYLQQVGRILRPAFGKTRGLVLDHVGNCLRHGLPDDEREWTLNGERKRPPKDDEFAALLRQCKKCFFIWPEKSIKCPACGHINEKLAEPRQPQQVEGELQQISKEEIQRLNNEAESAFAKAESYQEMVALCRKYGRKPGYAYYRWNNRIHRRKNENSSNKKSGQI